MKRPLLVGALLLLVVSVLSILGLRKEEFSVSERVGAPINSEISSPRSEETAPLSEASDRRAAPPPNARTIPPTEAELERELPARFGVENLQSTMEGFEAGLLVDGIPLVGARLFLNSESGVERRQIVPALQRPPVGRHSKSFDSQVEAKANQEARSLKNCQILSIGKSRQIWFNANDAGVIPAYAIEIYGICSRVRKREDWIYRDPDLERVGRVLNRN